MLEDLSALPDAALCVRVRAGDRDAADVIIRRHRGLVGKIIKRFALPPEVSFEDIAAEGYQALWNAAKAYRPESGYKFGTYAYACASNAMRRAVGEHIKRAAGWQGSEVFCDRDEDDGHHRKPRFLDLIPDRPHPELDPQGVREWVEGLPLLQRQVVELAYGLDGEPPLWSEIADRFGLTVMQAKLVCSIATGGAEPPQTSPEAQRHVYRKRNRSKSGRAAASVC